MKNICPAIGWTAIYEDTNEDGKKTETPVPLACWALRNDCSVVGLVPDNGVLREAQFRQNFKCYDYDTEGALVDFAMLNNDSE